MQYRQNISPTVTHALEEFTGAKQADQILHNDTSIVKETPIAQALNTILEFATKGRASDIHIEPQETKTRVRYRIDGILYEKLSLPKSLHESLVSRIKILSQMRIDERRLPQDGRFTFRVSDQEVDLGVQFANGTRRKTCYAFIKKTGGIPSLPDLGLDGVSQQNLESAI